MQRKFEKVAIVHDFLTKIGGAEKVLLELLTIYPSAEIFTLFYDQRGTKNLFCKYNIHSSKLQKHKTKAPKYFKYLLPYYPAAIESFDLSEFDLCISLSNSFAHGVITNKNCLHVCYLLSPTRYLYDWKNEYLHENKLHGGVKTSLIQNSLSKIRLWDTLAATRPDRYISISNHVNQRLKKYYRLESDVLYPPVDVNSFKYNGYAGEDYYIIISRLSAYKNIDLAIAAFNELKKSLIIIGTGEDYHRLKEMSDSNIEFLGWQSDLSVREYLFHAKALIFPGEEDFGLTPIEAMSSGRPVIAYRKGGVTETIRDGISGLFFDQPNKNSLIEAVKKFEVKQKNFNYQKIRCLADQFDRTVFSEKFVNLIKNYVKTN